MLSVLLISNGLSSVSSGVRNKLFKMIYPKLLLSLLLNLYPSKFNRKSFLKLLLTHEDTVSQDNASNNFTGI